MDDHSNGKTTVGLANGSFPPTKAQQYSASRPAYRLPAPAARAQKHRRGCCCRCCLWTTIVVLILIFLVAIAGVIFYILYRPHSPTFTISSLKIATLNLTSSSNSLTSNIDLQITARNPNKKITFTYDDVLVSVLASDVAIGGGSAPGFTQSSKSNTLLKIPVSSKNLKLEDDSAKTVSTQLSGKKGLKLKVKADTKVVMKIGSVKVPKIKIRVVCDGIKGSVPNGNSSSSATFGDSSCEVDLKYKVWKWNI